MCRSVIKSLANFFSLLLPFLFKGFLSAFNLVLLEVTYHARYASNVIYPLRNVVKCAQQEERGCVAVGLVKQPSRKYKRKRFIYMTIIVFLLNFRMKNNSIY